MSNRLVLETRRNGKVHATKPMIPTKPLVSGGNLLSNGAIWLCGANDKEGQIIGNLRHVLTILMQLQALTVRQSAALQRFETAKSPVAGWPPSTTQRTAETMAVAWLLLPSAFCLLPVVRKEWSEDVGEIERGRVGERVINLINANSLHQVGLCTQELRLIIRFLLSSLRLFFQVTNLWMMYDSL